MLLDKTVNVIDTDAVVRELSASEVELVNGGFVGIAQLAVAVFVADFMVGQGIAEYEKQH